MSEAPVQPPNHPGASPEEYEAFVGKVLPTPAPEIEALSGLPMSADSANMLVSLHQEQGRPLAEWRAMQAEREALRQERPWLSEEAIDKVMNRRHPNAPKTINEVDNSHQFAIHERREALGRVAGHILSGEVVITDLEHRALPVELQREEGTQASSPEADQSVIPPEKYQAVSLRPTSGPRRFKQEQAHLTRQGRRQLRRQQKHGWEPTLYSPKGERLLVFDANGDLINGRDIVVQPTHRENWSEARDQGVHTEPLPKMELADYYDSGQDMVDRGIPLIPMSEAIRRDAAKRKEAIGESRPGIGGWLAKPARVLSAPFDNLREAAIDARANRAMRAADKFDAIAPVEIRPTSGRTAELLRAAEDFIGDSNPEDYHTSGLDQLVTAGERAQLRQLRNRLERYDANLGRRERRQARDELELWVNNLRARYRRYDANRADAGSNNAAAA